MIEQPATITVHGHAFLAEYVGPGRLRNIDGVSWSDINGLRRGSGVSYGGEPHTRNYFHASVPVPYLPLFNPYLTAAGGNRVSFANELPTIREVVLGFSTVGPAFISHIGHFDGINRFDMANRDDDAIRNGTARPVLGSDGVYRPATSHELRRGLGVSVGVTFGDQDARITFTSLAVRLTYGFWQDSDPIPG